jgi:predicted TPR repeat methyltransferase
MPNAALARPTMTSSKSAPTAHQDPNLPGLIEVERLIKAGRLQQAAGLLNQLQTRVIGDPRVYMMGTQLAEAAGQPAGALKAARHAVKVAPQFAPAVLNLALLLARQNQFQEAAEQAQQAVALAPGHLPTLQGAIDIAHRAGYAALALEFLPHAIELAAPKNGHFKRQMAQDLAALGRNAEAIALFDGLLKADPADQASLQGRAHAALALGDSAAAQRDWDALVALDPANEAYRFNQQVAHGKTPAALPDSVPGALFDEMAEVFDQHLVNSLGYRLPRQVANWILQAYPTRELNLLDLGCGTGLLGACLGPVKGYVIGVDISSKMIEKAAQHGVYYRFHQVGVLDALKGTPENLYEVLTALDVFPYIGDLAQAIPDAHRINKPGGHFVFSCERALETEADWLLRPTQRYAHKQSHIEALCKSAGFAEVTVQDTTLRYEGDQPVNGFLVTARKAAEGEEKPAAKPAAAKKKTKETPVAAVEEAPEAAKPKAVRKPRVVKKKEDGAG